MKRLLSFALTAVALSTAIGGVAGFAIGRATTPGYVIVDTPASVEFVPSRLVAPAEVQRWADVLCFGTDIEWAASLTLGVTVEDFAQVVAGRDSPCVSTDYRGSSHGAYGVGEIFVLANAEGLETWYVVTWQDGQVVGVE